MKTSAEHWVKVFNSNPVRPIVLVCEHASNFVPPGFNGLGLNEQQLQSHIAWDPGALKTARLMAHKLEAALVASQVS